MSDSQSQPQPQPQLSTAQPAPTRAVTPPLATATAPRTSSPVSAMSVPVEASSSRVAPPAVPTPAPAPVATPQPAATTTPQPTNAPMTLTPNALLAQAVPEKDNAPKDDFAWMLKIGGRAVLIIVGLIGLGCIAWAFSTAIGSGSGYSYYYGYFTDERWSLPWALITFSLSILWSAICVFVYLFRSRPVHPGLAVAFDLILWLAFIPTALFALVALTSLKSWGADGSLGYASYGEYNLNSNGTWVWEWDSRAFDSDYYYSPPERDCNSTSSSRSSYGSYRFSTCEEEEAFINDFWHNKPERERIITAGVACQFIGLVVHFALFVWACVDTNIRNRSKNSKDAEKLAAEIVMNMVRNGAIIPPPGQAHMRPPVGMYPVYAQPMPGQYYPQPMPGQPQPQMYQQPYPLAPQQAGTSSTEKSEGQRYA